MEMYGPVRAFDLENLNLNPDVEKRFSLYLTEHGIHVSGCIALMLGWQTDAEKEVRNLLQKFWIRW